MSHAVSDAHLHLFAPGAGGPFARADVDVDAYELLREQHNIALGLVIGYEGPEVAPGNNAYLRVLASGREWMRTLAYVAGSPAPTPEHLHSLLDSGHVGISIYPATEPGALDAWSPDAWHVLEQWRAIVSVNAPPVAIAALTRVVRAHPDCAFLFSHLGLPGQFPLVPSRAEASDILAPLLDLADAGNTHVKISGLYATDGPGEGYPHHAAEPFVMTLLDTYGASRCLWGSDFRPSLDHVTFEQVLDSPYLHFLSPRESSAVLGGNLTTLLGAARRGGSS